MTKSSADKQTASLAAENQLQPSEQGIPTVPEALLIGITGGIGTGKSAVSSLIQEHGFPVLNADAIARELMQSDPEIMDELKDAFGQEVYLQDGILNTAYLASCVFGAANQQKLRILNSIVHPIMLDELFARALELAEQGSTMICIEMALLYEIELEEGFDYIIGVDCSKEVRIQRLLKKGMDLAQIEARMAAQVNPAEIQGKADFMIDNSGTLEQLRSSVDMLMNIIPFLPSRNEQEDQENIN
jgi:dephospho-CoA kinase